MTEERQNPRGSDLHTRNAAKMFGVAVEDVTSDMRRAAKQEYYAQHYGVSFGHGGEDRGPR